MDTQTQEISKESIMSTFERQINQLIKQYEIKIKKLEAEKFELLDEILKSKNQIKEQELKINELMSRQILSNEAAKDNESELFLESIQNLSVSRRIKKQIELLEQYNKENNYKFVSLIFNNLKKDFNKLGENEIRRLNKVLLGMFLTKSKDINKMTGLYQAALNYFKESFNNKEVKSFISKNSELLNRRFLDIKEHSDIIELAKIYSAFKVPAERDYLKNILEEWPFSKERMDEKSLIELFWLCFNHGLENRCLKAFDVHFPFKLNTEPEMKIYFLYKDMFDGKADPVSIADKINVLKKKINRFDNEEQNVIFKSLYKRINKKLTKVRSNSKAVINCKQGNMVTEKVRKISFVSKLPNERQIVPGTNYKLQEEWVDLAVYKDASLKGTPIYTFVKVLSQNRMGKVYVTPRLFQAIKFKIGQNRYIDTRLLDNSSSFSWPSTEVKGNTSSSLQENSTFNEESELKKVGYQITGLSKEKRWVYLEKAVQQIGLKKVAYTIAQNVKLRKGQKNGEKKFSYAISQWEYDLAKLKKHYYKNDFSWPTTKIK